MSQFFSEEFQNYILLRCLSKLTLFLFHFKVQNVIISGSYREKNCSCSSQEFSLSSSIGLCGCSL